MEKIIVDLAIAADEFINHYRQPGAVVLAISRDGRSVRFPASILQAYVGHHGVYGSYVIEFDERGKFVGITPHSSP